MRIVIKKTQMMKNKDKNTKINLMKKWDIIKKINKNMGNLKEFGIF